nr:MAG TPA: LASP-1 DOMAIN, ZINC-FINGER, METAL-BINDING PROTEIN [Caudoviricetes sp.]
MCCISYAYMLAYIPFCVKCKKNISGENIQSIGGNHKCH